MTEKKRRSEDSRKAAALRQHGSLNPRPGGVGNDLFRTYDFFDPNDLVQVKYENAAPGVGRERERYRGCRPVRSLPAFVL
jgi:hypothetical protein